MIYSFDDRIAKQYGVEAAIFIHNLYWWITKNEANGRHYHDGRSWTYNSMKAFTELLPFFTERKIRNIISKLKEDGVLHVSNYNEKPFDRTQWYALDEEIFALYRGAESVDSMCQKRQMEVTKTSNGSDKNVRPIPDSKPYSKPDSKHISASQKQTDLICSKITDPELQELLLDFVQSRKEMKAKLTDRALEMSIERLLALSDQPEERKEIVKNAIRNGWKGFYPIDKKRVSSNRIAAPPSYDIQQIDSDSIRETLEFGA